MIQVETARRCTYCHRRPSAVYCSRCLRVLCLDCYAGLQCPKKCHPRPDGTGVR